MYTQYTTLNRNLKIGYHTLGITALTSEKKLPIPVYTRIYSAEEKGFISED